MSAAVHFWDNHAITTKCRILLQSASMFGGGVSGAREDVTCRRCICELIASNDHPEWLNQELRERAMEEMEAMTKADEVAAKCQSLFPHHLNGTGPDADACVHCIGEALSTAVGEEREVILRVLEELHGTAERERDAPAVVFDEALFQRGVMSGLQAAMDFIRARP